MCSRLIYHVSSVWTTLHYTAYSTCLCAPHWVLIPLLQCIATSIATATSVLLLCALHVECMNHTTMHCIHHMSKCTILCITTTTSVLLLSAPHVKCVNYNGLHCEHHMSVCTTLCMAIITVEYSYCNCYFSTVTMSTTWQVCEPQWIILILLGCKYMWTTLNYTVCTTSLYAPHCALIPLLQCMGTTTATSVLLLCALHVKCMNHTALHRVHHMSVWPHCV
jgi:hypothetical protein